VQRHAQSLGLDFEVNEELGLFVVLRHDPLAWAIERSHHQTAGGELQAFETR